MALYQLIDTDGTVDRMTFNTAGKYGRLGPTLAECRNYYGGSNSSWWNDSNNYLLYTMNMPKSRGIYVISDCKNLVASTPHKYFLLFLLAQCLIILYAVSLASDPELQKKTFPLSNGETSIILSES